LCQIPAYQLHAAAVRFYREAFAAEPKLAEQEANRYKAACEAALAGCGQGKDVAALGAPERDRLRRQALDWLRGELDSYRMRLPLKLDKCVPEVRNTMQHWLQDPDFNGVRDAAALAKLADTERQEWQKLWQEVQALERRAADQEPSAAFERPLNVQARMNRIGGR
jgi:hypothetical protein